MLAPEAFLVLLEMLNGKKNKMGKGLKLLSVIIVGIYLTTSSSGAGKRTK